ncbi:MAG: complex I subunit 5 family protein, partial [Eubacteriaceae bacterium]
MVSLYWFILFPVIVGIAGLLLSDKISNILSLLGQTLTFVYAIMLFFTVHQDGQVFQIIGNWPQSIGIGLKADTTSIVFVLLTSFLFLILILFSMNSSYSDKLFNFLFLSVEGLISFVFLANDLFTIFVSLEVSTIIVSILIMYKKDKRSIYDGMMYLLINIFAMSFFLLGLGMLYKQTGFLDIGDITKQITLINNKKDLILPYAFMLTAVSLKSALMPLFSWLPKAHGTPGAPAVVSALLSGLFVKSGIYLFIRLQFMFSAAIDTQLLFLILGFTTAIVGIILCLQQTDIKLILAYSTVAQLGLIMIGLNFSSSQAFYGSLYHIINHAIFKVGLFLAAGLIIEEYQTRDINKIKGLLKRMPATGIAIILF